MSAPLLTDKQAGERLGMSARWVRNEALHNRIPHVRLGRYVRFDADALDAWVAARLQGPLRTDPGSPAKLVMHSTTSAPAPRQRPGA